MEKRKLWIVLIGVLLLIAVAGCGKKAATAAKENSLIYASESEFDGLNPILEETNVDALLFRGLFRFDENNEPKADIASSFTMSDDKLTYTFKLQEDIRFHDGEPLTAEDVIFTIESVLDDKNASFLKS
ncbi:MAG TPA: ABC transporter substrate-binding protein, partial [Sporosarcina sp.]|nr:ABC transporter substrate-binding protein [Sporosarcina sp.]